MSDQRLIVLRRMDALTPKEREVMEGVVRGEANKTIEANLGISVRTVELHRRRVFYEMGAESLAHLIQMVAQVDVV